MNTALSAVFKPVYVALPERVRASIDFYLRPSLRHSWGGPLNGQNRRSEQVLEILGLTNPDYIVETGTYRGTTTEFFAQVFENDIWSCEINGSFHLYSKKRLKRYNKVHLVKAESTTFLEEFVRSPTHCQATTLFYLDAHWLDHLPLQRELDIIFSSVAEAVVVIDDFQVPDDPGYLFDDYGSGRALTLDYLTSLRDYGFHIFFPAAPAETESGEKRGCIVLTTAPRIFDLLQGSTSLRYHGLSTETL